MSRLFDARYFSQDGVIALVIAAFCLGLIVGALVMDHWGDRPARVRPVAPVKPAARHRATPGVPMKGGQAVVANAPRLMTQDEIPAPPPRTRIDVRA